jgi:hypothetical protein
MHHCRLLSWILAGIVALPLARCADSGEIGGPTAPSALSAPNGGLTALLENAPFTGQDSGTFEFTQDSCTAGLAPLRTHTAGTATLIGAYSFETQECFDNATLTFSGSFTITAANGDRLSGAYAGHVTGFLDEVTAVSVFTATVTGGTGRFAGATGTLSGTGQANLATFQES